MAIAIFALLVGGLGVKAALFPLHAWLPRAMVAPAPVSALLHAVAVVKAGVFGIVRVIDDVYGVGVAASLGVLPPLLVIASFTIIYGSYQALRQSDLKKRLAYSTVSQVSYVVLGVALATVAGVTGGVVHLVHQGIMKITLFFCAGLYAEVLGAKRIDQLRGLGHRMPGTSIAFTVGAFGMIGLPVVYRLWFHDPAPEDDDPTPGRVHEPKALLVPALVTATGLLIFGLAASLPFLPLQIAGQIAEGVFS